MLTQRASICFVVVMLTVLVFSAIVKAEGFYDGKTVRVIVGYGPGGGPDFRARLVARHIGKYLPGRPNVIVQNMPGAGGVISANYLFNVAKANGLVLSNVARGPFMKQLGEQVGIKFDMTKFSWVGSIMREGNVAFIRSDQPYRNLADLKKAKKPIIFGARSRGATNYLAGKALEYLGVPVKLVVGYGTSKMNLAFAQGEIEGSALGWTSLKTGRPDWIKPGGIARLIAEFGTEATPGISAAFGPNLKPMAGKEQIYKLINKALGLTQGNLAAPPGTPRERVQELRQAYQKMLKDPNFRSDATRLGIPVRALVGKKLAQKVRDFFQGVSPKGKVEFKKLLR